jgi:hypothetical protein
METKDMNKGVQILLERMDSNPEEFYTDETKWLDLLGMVISRAKQLAGERPPSGLKPVISNCCLTDDEVIVLHTKMQQIQANEFTNRVMERLLGSDENLPYPYETSKLGGIPSDGQGTFGYSDSSIGYPKSVISSPDMLDRIKTLLKGSKV